MNKTDLIQKIKQLKGISQDERSYLINLVNTKKKYGLVWEDKPEEVEEQLRTQLPVLREVVEKRIMAEPETKKSEPPMDRGRQGFKGLNDSPDSKKTKLFQPSLFEEAENQGNHSNQENQSSDNVAAPNHILIEGDNLHALTALTFTHEGKIDVIYIDPPYNTGNKEDFIYNDQYIDKEDSFRHSKWLSFMSKRLVIAKRLLKEDGVIFCSIGDDEISQLTLLFNEIFTEQNKLGVIARLAKPADDQGNYFSSSKDYIIAYTKNINILANFKDSVNELLFKKIETSGPKKGEKYRDDVAFYQASLGVRPNLRYYVKCPDGSLVIPPGLTFPTEKLDGAQSFPQSDEDKCWRWSAEKYQIDKNLLVYKKSNKTPLVDEFGNQAKWNIYTKSYLNDRSEKGASPRDYLDQFINRKGADLIKHYDVKFNYSKPYELIQHLVKICNKPNNINILDFFAGSGTTLHSIVSLNEIDNGKRKCIIATNNENNICIEVTYPRCERIMNSYTNKKGVVMPYYPSNNLRYFKCDFVGREHSLKNKRELTRLATELLCIKEDCYEEKALDFDFINPSDRKNIRFFEEKEKRMVVVYDDSAIESTIELIKSIIASNQVKGNGIKVYVFSPGQYPFTEEFEEVLPYISLCALPDAIYKALMNVLPIKNRSILPELEEEAENSQPQLFE